MTNIKLSLLAALIAIVCSFNSNAQTKSIDSLSLLIKNKTINDSTRIEAMVELATALMYNDPQRAIQINDEALEKSQKGNYIRLEVLAYFTKALIYNQIGSLDSAKLFCLKSITLAEQSSNHPFVGRGYSLLGIIHLSQGNYALALKYYMNSLEKYKEISHKTGMASTLNRIGMFYYTRDQYETARYYYEESLVAFKELKRYDHVSGILNNIGVSYYQENDFYKALDYYDKSLKILYKIDMPEKLAIREVNIGKAYIKLKDYEKAGFYIQKALSHAQQFSDKNLLCQTLLQLGILKRIQNDNTTALDHFMKGLSMAKEMGDHDTEIEYYENIAKSYAEEDSYRQAYVYYQKFDFLKDSLLNIEKNREILLLQSQFEAKQNEQKIAILQHEAEKKNIILSALVAGSFLLALSMILMLINYKNKQRSLRLIHRQKEEISRQKISELLKDQELNSIKNKLEGQQNERKRIAQELHDGIGGTLASIKMNLLRLNKDPGVIKTKLDDVIIRLDNACEEVRMISHNLIPPVLHNSALTEVIKNFVDEIIGSKEITVNYEFYPKKQLEAIDKNVQVDLYRIIQELVTNVVKHAKATEINIYLTMHDDYVNLMVEDNGVGFKNDGKQTGIGLKNIQSRVAALEGKITIDTNVGTGTIIIIDLLLQHRKQAELYTIKST